MFLLKISKDSDDVQNYDLVLGGTALRLSSVWVIVSFQGGPKWLLRSKLRGMISSIIFPQLIYSLCFRFSQDFAILPVDLSKPIDAIGFWVF